MYIYIIIYIIIYIQTVIKKYIVINSDNRSHAELRTPLCRFNLWRSAGPEIGFLRGSQLPFSASGYPIMVVCLYGFIESAQMKSGAAYHQGRNDPVSLQMA